MLLRYPAGAKTWGKASNAERPFGYHDDSFAWATLDTGKEADSWFYMPALKDAGPAAMAKWKSHPIGGEIRPEAWGRVFDLEPGDKKIQSFRECVEQTHVTWLMDSGMFRKEASQERRERAAAEVRRMGYEFHVSAIQYSIENSRLKFQLEIQNRGVAPFYYDWKGSYGLIANGEAQKTMATSGKLTGIQPSEMPAIWNDEIELTELPKGSYTLALLIPNALPKGLPLRFANVSQDQDLAWLVVAGDHRKMSLAPMPLCATALNMFPTSLSRLFIAWAVEAVRAPAEPERLQLGRSLALSKVFKCVRYQKMVTGVALSS